MKANAQLHKIREFGEKGLLTSDYCEWGVKKTKKAKIQDTRQADS